MQRDFEQQSRGSVRRRGIAVALSGGGHRACLFGLGAMLYLVDAGKQKDLVTISSVSGGSLLNGAIAQGLDVTSADKGEFERVAAQVAGQISGRGTLFGTGWAVAYVFLLAVVGLATLVLPWLAPWPVAVKIGAVLLGLLLTSWLAGFRGKVCAFAFDRTLFRPDGASTPLRAVGDGADHVFCATDLHSGKHVYFSPRFVRSSDLGRGDPGDVKLSTVVQASAAFPGAFPPAWVPVSRVGLRPRGSRRLRLRPAMPLVDGGVYDNMGDQWTISAEERFRTGYTNSDDRHWAAEMIVVNSSAGLDRKHLGRLRIPGLGEILALLRDKSILYENGNRLRRSQLVTRFIRSDGEGDGLRGALVHIPRSPFHVPDSFDSGTGPKSERARAALAALEAAGKPSREEWAEIAVANAGVATTLVAFDPAVSARLLHHAYVLAMVNLHVILGYPLLPLPDRSRFEALARGEA